MAVTNTLFLDIIHHLKYYRNTIFQKLALLPSIGDRDQEKEKSELLPVTKRSVALSKGSIRVGAFQDPKTLCFNCTLDNGQSPKQGSF